MGLQNTWQKRECTYSPNVTISTSCSISGQSGCFCRMSRWSAQGRVIQFIVTSRKGEVALLPRSCKLCHILLAALHFEKHRLENNIAWFLSALAGDSYSSAWKCEGKGSLKKVQPCKYFHHVMKDWELVICLFGSPGLLFQNRRVFSLWIIRNYLETKQHSLNPQKRKSQNAP